MTTTSEAVLTLSFRERFTIALMRAGMTRGEFADFVGITRKTVWTWETLSVRPSKGALRVLATESGIPFEALEPREDEIEDARLLALLPRLDSNQQPADYNSLVVALIAEAEAFLLEAVAS